MGRTRPVERDELSARGPWAANARIDPLLRSCIPQDLWLLVLKQRHELELGDVYQTFVGEF